MFISDKIVASFVDGISGVYIYCPENLIDEVAESFEKEFESAWNKAMDDAEKEYDAVCQEKEDELGSPASVEKQDVRIFVKLEPLMLTMNYGARVDNEYGTAAIENTLKEFKKKYPEIEYEGVIAYEWADSHGGDVLNYEISSKAKDESAKIFEFAGELLHSVLDDENESEEFWDKLEMFMEEADEEEWAKVASDFHAYGLDDHLDKLLDMADEIDDEIRGGLEETINSYIIRGGKDYVS